MGMVHIVALLIGTVEFTEAAGDNLTDIRYDYCRYKFFIKPLTWMDAQKVCTEMNRTLAKVASAENLTSIVDMANSTVYPRVTHHLPSSSDIWIGLRAMSIYGSLTQYWEDCDTLGDDDRMWLNSDEQTSTGCVAINLDNGKFIVNHCSIEKRPYICEASSAVPCYDSVNWKTESIFSSFGGNIEIPQSEIGECITECITRSCIAFQHNPKCKVLTYPKIMSTHNLGQRNSIANTFGYIGLTVPYDANTLPAPSMTCFDSVSSFILSTSSFTALTTRTSPSISSSEVMDSIKSSEIERSMTSSTFEGLVSSTGLEGSMTSSGLEGSMTILVLEGTRTTPPLSISLTSSGLKDSTTAAAKPNISVTTSEHEDVSGLHSSSNETVCMCPCSMVSNTTYRREELERRITEIREKLKIDRKKTTVYKRSLISAPDESISVRNIGYVGVAVLAAICAIIVLVDLPKGAACLKGFINKCR